MLIFLVGMMGSGKTTTGKLLAEELGLPFFDTDEIISSIAGMPVYGIFSAMGEKYFRDLEHEVIENWKLAHGVIATGGGLPCHDGLMDLLNEKGRTVYLQCPEDVIFERIGNDPERPLIAGLSAQEARQKMETLTRQREPFYCQASIMVNATQLPEKLVSNIIRELYS